MFTQKQSLTESFVSPLVSVCIPTRNGAPFIEEALNSIIAQEYKNIEVIVSDDESTDNTLEVIKEFKIKVDFPVFIYSHKPSGIGANWNNCLKKANGELIKFLFQDDVLFAPCIKEMIQVFDQDINIGLVASKRTILVDDPDEDQLEWIFHYGDQRKEEVVFVNRMLILDNKFLKKISLLKHPTSEIGVPTGVL
jgi:glycosyltransferase involved in cell wall biosynthesis